LCSLPLFARECRLMTTRALSIYTRNPSKLFSFSISTPLSPSPPLLSAFFFYDPLHDMPSREPVGLSDLYPAQQVLYAVSLAAILIPAPSHFKKGNPGVILLICWLFSSQLILLVNSIVWRGNVRNPAPFWCDLSTAILAVIATGIACSTLCINRQLYNYTKVDKVNTNEPREVPFFATLLLNLFVDMIGYPTETQTIAYRPAHWFRSPYSRCWRT
jgi:hypothetical protein